jgi:hypothetical protein
VSITEVSNRVFSADSPDVVPPVGMRPKLSRQLPTNRSLDQLAPVEILVGLGGSVESVKFSRPVTSASRCFSARSSAIPAGVRMVCP